VAPGKAEFRGVMGGFATGVTIVTSRLGEERHGMTANSVTSVSLEPPLVLVCIDRSAESHDIIDASGTFALSILSRDQEALAARFAAKDGAAAHRLVDVPHHTRATGAPIIDGSLAYLDCRVAERFPGGDHTIFLGEVVDAGRMSDGVPLVFYMGRYAELA
jgi:flavin reductase (DIM6/NTAB) family NADH-FMN oxidoreductase RutF